MQKREDMIKKFLLMLLSGAFVSAAAVPARGDYIQIGKLTASDAAAGDVFGRSVAISGTTALVGARYDDDAGTDSGSAYLFDVSDPSNPVEIAKLTASDADGGDYFGYSVALSGSTALVGAYWDDDAGDRSGSAYLYDFSDPYNIIETKLTASDAVAVDYFGCSVAISGTTAIVGAYGNDDTGSQSGSSYLYDFNDPSNITEIKLTASDAAGGDRFGWSVAISGTTALVGACWDDDILYSNSGSAYLYDFSDPSNIIETKLTATDAAYYRAEFGWSVALSGSSALVGAYKASYSGTESGSAYLFEIATGSQTFQLTASDAAANDQFGYSVALSGATALVGAYVNGDAGVASGSAYLFDAGTGSQTFQLTASDAAANDQFGYSVALSGATALVGAPYDDDACPHKGNCNSGSAYLFCFSPAGDINRDCKVDLMDFALMTGNWLLDCLLEPSDPDCQAP